jgi:hypothetical protein
MEASRWGRPLLVTRMKTALACAFVTLVVPAAAPAAPAAGPRDSSLRLVSPHRYQVFQRGDGAFSLRLGARLAGQATPRVRSASRCGDDLFATGDVEALLVQG